MTASPADKLPQSEGSDQNKSLLNVPNTLCTIRLVGSLVMLALAWTDLSTGYFLAMIIFLQSTDWVDGKLAILLKQQTNFGAKLDSVADATFYGSTLLVTWWLKGDVLREEWPWIAAALGAYALNMAAAFAKFHRLPAYHTRMAKTGWLLISIAILAVYTDWSIWPLRIATAAVCITNLEEAVITFVLLRPHVDIPSLYHAFKIRREQQKTDAAESAR